MTYPQFWNLMSLLKELKVADRPALSPDDEGFVQRTIVEVEGVIYDVWCAEDRADAAERHAALAYSLFREDNF